MTFRALTDDLWIAPQLTTADVQVAADQGVALIVNNRPDGEEPGQPDGVEIAAAARAAGIEYVAVPIAGRPGPGDARALRQALAVRQGRALLYCRSGMRSAAVWALAATGAGEIGAEDARALAAAAGYDLSGLLL